MSKESILQKAPLLYSSGDIRLYKRPSITSGIGDGEEKIKRGMTAFVEDEEYNNGDWIEISGGSWKDKTIFKGWVRKDPDKISTDIAMAVSAIRLEQYLEELKSNKEEVHNRAVEGLESLARSSLQPISDIARETLEVNATSDESATPDAGSNSFFNQ